MSAIASFVGRRSELAVLEERLAAARRNRPQVVYVEGEPGLGKSTLLARFLESLTNVAVLQVCGEESETLLAYGVVDQIERGTATDAATDPVVVGARLLRAFDRLQAAGRTAVVAVDDLQWVDRPSSGAVLFALRRLRADRLLAVVATRPEEPGDTGWARFVAADPRVTRLRLSGLSPADLAELAERLRLGPLPERSADRLAAHTGGNPLYARALLEEIGVAGLDVSPEEGLPAPREVATVILGRVAALSPGARDLLAAAAVLGQHAAMATLVSAAQLPDARAALDEAVGAGLVSERRSGAELVFAHPLFRTAVYTDLSPTRRRDLHTRAAGLMAGRAGLAHRVAASLGSDDDLAADLETYARREAGPGDVGEVAWALEQAAILSTDGGQRERRLLDSADALLDAADTAAAARVLASAYVPSARREAQLGLLDVFAGAPSAEERLVAAWRAHEPATEPEVGARAATSLANWMAISGRPADGLRWAERAVESTAEGSWLRAQARIGEACALAAAGRSEDGLAALGFLPAAAQAVPVAATDALVMRGLLEMFADDLAGAVADLRVAAARIRGGRPSTYPGPCLAGLSEALFRQGDWDAAAGQADTAIAWAQHTDRPLDLARAHGQMAVVLGCRGHRDAAARHVAAARAAADRFPVVFVVAAAATAAAAAASARGDLPGVLAATEPVRATGALIVGGCPGIFDWRGLEVDALIGLGRFAAAAAALDEFQEAIPAAGLPSAALTVARCRGNLATARGRHDIAEQQFAVAHRIAAQVPMPFEQALLCLDDARRLQAAGDRAACADRLERAHRLFAALRAEPWVRVCAAELGSLRLATPAGDRDGDPDADLGLSRAELAVAHLAAAGRTNREVADELYLSVKTVEYHLHNAFGKLQIRSRRQLPASLR